MEILVCPIMSIYKDVKLCLREKCAWWIPYGDPTSLRDYEGGHGNCAIKDISLNTENIQS